MFLNNKICMNNNKENASNIIELKFIRNSYYEDENGYPVFSGSISVKPRNNIFLKKHTAVYFFHDVRGIHYIGETVDLENRYFQHIEKNKNRKLKKAIENSFGPMQFSWVKVRSKVEALKLQKKWIREFNPKCNEIKYRTKT